MCLMVPDQALARLRGSNAKYRAELKLEKTQNTKLRESMKQLGKLDDDLMLLTSAPIRAGQDRRSLAEELEKATRTIADKQIKIDQLEASFVKKALQVRPHACT
eukprot:SAG11_NODE_6698_length_1264_cov_1.854077_3_plen_104_part_00